MGQTKGFASLSFEFVCDFVIFERMQCKWAVCCFLVSCVVGQIFNWPAEFLIRGRRRRPGAAVEYSNDATSDGVSNGNVSL